MAVFRCFWCILYFFICFVISRSPVQVRPVAPRAEIISAFYFFFFRNEFQNSIRNKKSHFVTEWDFVCLFDSLMRLFPFHTRICQTETYALCCRCPWNKNNKYRQRRLFSLTFSALFLRFWPRNIYMSFRDRKSVV